MSIRTDLALDVLETLSQEEKGKVEQRNGGITITTIVISEKEAEHYQKPPGTYITVEFPPLLTLASQEDVEEAILEALRTLYPQKSEPMLVAGLGNTDITADSIGPKTASRLLATRHISRALAKNMGLEELQSVAVIAPGVLGKTGMETAELIGGAASVVNPAAVLVVDALASGSVTRLFQTVQLCDSGISPGSGVKNSRKEISCKTVGVPVIAVGVPTVVDAGVLAEELTGSEVQASTDMVVTPKDADLLCEKISELLAAAINRFLQPKLEKETLWGLL